MATINLVSRLFADLLISIIGKLFLSPFAQATASLTTVGRWRKRSNLSGPCCFYSKGEHEFSTDLQKEMIDYF